MHDSHSDYPLCPEKIEVSSDMLSKYCKDIANWYGIKVGRVKKMIPNLGDKVKYVVHYKNLQYYLSLGMKLVKVHRILSFKKLVFKKSMLTLILSKDKQVPMSLIKTCINC